MVGFVLCHVCFWRQTGFVFYEVGVASARYHADGGVPASSMIVRAMPLIVRAMPLIVPHALSAFPLA